jgi:alkylation response protein AidB-like acyl-CoA dehydrogenase
MITKEAHCLDRRSTRQFVEERIIPRANEWDRTERIPPQMLAEMSAAGLWGAVLPVAAGGGGVDLVTLGSIHEEVGRGCSSLRSLLTVHTMVSWAVYRWGTPIQHEKWLARLSSGAVLGAFCLTEPEAGSDTHAMSASAVQRGGRWILNGCKKWITGGQVAKLFLVFARTQSGPAAFLVPRGATGVQVRPIHGLLGTRASMLAEVSLHDADAGPDALLGPERFANGLVMIGALDLGRYSVACGCVGIAQACQDACADYTLQRRVAGRSLRELDLIRAKMADMVTGCRAARLLCEKAGMLKDAGDQATIMATWVAKYFAAKAAAAAATDAVQIHGANGCGADYPVERFYRDAKIMEIIEGSSEIQQITIAEEAYRGAGDQASGEMEKCNAQ